ncbi:hypothetical protein EJP69_19410 [Variovorax gossypii]|uniref:Uncharacterized protein n=1 Tax=Variovorax gossypii TaxID=1679495 RepID=A0A3S0GZC9_9BURK|nr:hypothetical protein [Variovorax gossypii]RTQ32881.1 hypothetical protein EJP69_19410 [Variovorax gossypii]
MRWQAKCSLIGAAMPGVGGFAVAWYSAATSREAELAREYLMTAPSLDAKYKSIDGLMLTGFRIARPRSHFTYWASTGDGHKRIQVIVDKIAEPWSVAVPSDAHAP